MNFKEYVQLAVRTESLWKVVDENHPQKNVSNSLFHSAIGIQTEVGEIFEALYIREGEIDNVNLREEVGDIMWYIAIAANVLGFYDLDFDADFDTSEYQDVEQYAQAMNYLSTNILDSFKKSLFYNKPFDTELFTERLSELFNLSGAFVEILGSDIESICDINIKKLQARYPEKFTTEKAVNRDLKTERSILESQ